MIAYLNTVDYTIIVIYFLFLVGMGIYLKRRASENIEEYFLGGHKLPWYMMGVSGMASFLDVAGTMLIVSFLFMMGPRGLFIEFRGGAALVLAFVMAWTGKWHYRAKVMTGAEWMKYRFGDSWGAQFARIMSVVSTIVFTIGMLAYLIKGVGLFLAMFLPFTPLVCSLILIGIATIYTIFSGFYGVVYTDLFQSVIIVIAVIFVSVMAMGKFDSLPELADIAYRVTGSTDWISSSLQWHTEMPPGYEMYKDLMLFVIFYLLKTIVGSLGFGADPKYFGARSEREAGLTSMLWINLMTFRWPFMISFAVIGLFMVNKMIPDQEILMPAMELIKAHIPNATQENWQEIIANIINYPDKYSPELIGGVKEILQSDWQNKLQLLSYHGTLNPERILPAVILTSVPIGFRGLMLIALIAASMSTFDSTINTTAGYFIRDLYQRYIRPTASNKELIYTSYIFILVSVILGFLMAFSIRSMNDIWVWIMMGLGSGISTAMMLKFYWWRFNGEGFSIGTLVGLVFAILQRLIFPDIVGWVQFTTITVFTLLATILATYLTKPIDENVLVNFYKTTRPFGFWKPYRNCFSKEEQKIIRCEHRNDLISLPFILLSQVTLFLLPMQLIIKNYNSFIVTISLFLIGVAGVYWFWYRNLDAATVEDSKEKRLSN